jgi:hypothetical protein
MAAVFHDLIKERAVSRESDLAEARYEGASLKYGLQIR